MIDQMFYDVFAKEYVLDREEIAPPERYIPIVRGANLYIESWCVNCVNHNLQNVLNIAFSENDYLDAAIHSMIVETKCRDYDCMLTRLRDITFPNKKFDEIYNSLKE